MAAYPSQEHRPLKKPCLGPPDVYPQEHKQREDELNQNSVKHGFSNMPQFSDEHGSEKNADITIDKFGTYFSSVLTKKMEYNTLQDSKKRPTLPQKEIFWHGRSKPAVMEAWFKDLAGEKPLSQMGKRVPLLNRKEDVFSKLCEYNISMVRASWFIKMMAVYNSATMENRNGKRRQTVDQASEWAVALTKYLKDQLQKIQEYYHGGTATQTSFLTAQTPLVSDMELALKQWNYCCRLARHTYNEGLLDRHEYLSWLVELLEKMKQPDDTVLKLIIFQVLHYMDEITNSALLSRKLAYVSSKKISILCSDVGNTTPRTQSPMLTTTSNGNVTSSSNNQQFNNPIAAMFAEYGSCPQHRTIVLNLSAILQTITLRCPTALVWNSLGDGKLSNYICGSPLDVLPCAPSSLPMLPGPHNQQCRNQIRMCEQQIKQRGRMAEARWSSDKCQQSATGKGATIFKVLNVLDLFDRHKFDLVDVANNMDSLYNKIFACTQNQDNNESLPADDSVIRLLLDLAVSTRRCGDHRAIVVAKLLERRQSEIRSEKYGENDMVDDKDSIGSDTMVTPSIPVFQHLLMDFLDTSAPVLEDNPSEENSLAFKNLIHLFCELTRHDVFSHDAYMCTLISRGELMRTPAPVAPFNDSLDLGSVKSLTDSYSIKHEPQDDIKVDISIENMESDFTNLIGSVKYEPKSSPDPPASVKSTKSDKGDSNVPSVGESLQNSNQQKGPSRHMQYVTHFPLPQDEYSIHECNQRMMMLYGVGKARDEARHFQKKISKEVLRLYGKRNSIDINSGDLGKVRKKKEKEGEGAYTGQTPSLPNLEAIFQKFKKLSYFDQHAVTNMCVSTVLEQMISFIEGNSSYLAKVEHVAYLFDMMEHAMNINGLIDFIVKLLNQLCEVVTQLKIKESTLVSSYTMTLGLCIVSVLRNYNSYMLVSQEQTAEAFEGLIGVMRLLDVSNPADCTSPSRCMLAYLCDTYSCNIYLKNKYSEMFNAPYNKMKNTLYATVNASSSNLRWDPSFMIDVITGCKGQIDQQFVRQVQENGLNLYSFVCNATLNICGTQQPERLNDIAILCAEFTARCNALSSEWLGVLKALCCSSNNSCGFIDVLTQIDVSDMSIHDSLSVFTAILIARHCFSLQDFVIHVALPSLMSACPSAGGDQDAESGARLTCHLLLRLFKTSHLTQPQPGLSSGSRNAPLIKSSADCHLLEAAHDSITVGGVLAVLKAILMLGDSYNDDDYKAKNMSSNAKDKSGDIFSNLLQHLDDDEIDLDLLGSSMTSKNSGVERAGLSEFAKYSLREMCSQEWVREKFLKEPEYSLFHEDMLLDNLLSPKQAHQLLQMICYPTGVPNQYDGTETDNKSNIIRILQTLDKWSLRVSWLELQFMFKQSTSVAEKNSLLDIFAKGTIDLFHQQTESNKSTNNSSPTQHKKSDSDDSIWLVAPLISKLSANVQGRVLKSAGQVLESGNNLVSKSKFDKEKNQKSKSLLGHQPFLSLVLSCLKGQDEQREGLLNSLHSQLEKFIFNMKEILEKSPDEYKIRQDLHKDLQLRLSLVGGMIDTIQRNSTTTSEWALLLLMLISYGVVDTQTTNNELFTTVLDMLSVLVHGTLLSEEGDKGEENKKAYTNLIKKLKKELGDKQSNCIDRLRQLLPIPKRQYDIITCETYGTLVDTKGNKIAGFDSIGKKQGLQAAQKLKVNPWEVIEGYRNAHCIPWASFSAIKTEKKIMRYEEHHRLSLYHSHLLTQPEDYYLEAPPLPPEELEPPPEKVEEKVKDALDSNNSDGGKKAKPTRRRRQSKAGSTPYMQPPTVRPYPYGPEPNMYQPPGPSNWYNNQPPQPPNYGYNQPMTQNPRPRFNNMYNNSNSNTNSKMMLNNFLQSRTKPPPSSTSYIGPGAQPQMQNMMQKHHNQQLIRNHIFQKHQKNSGMYGNSMASGAGPHVSMHPMQQGMSGNYQGYNTMPQPGNRMMEPMNTGMMSQGYNQSYQGNQNTTMMNSGGNFIPQQPMPQSQQSYNPQQRLQQSMGTAGTMSNNNMSGYNQMGPSGTPSHQSYNMQQRMQQFRHQRMMQMQQGQSQGQPQQHPNASMGVPSFNQMQHVPQGQQYNNYQF